MNNIQEQAGDSTFHKLTVARIVDKPKEGYAEVTFLESARFYKLQHSNAHYATYMGLLQKAIKSKSVVDVRFTKANGDIIAEVIKSKKT